MIEERYDVMNNFIEDRWGKLIKFGRSLFNLSHPLGGVGVTGQAEAQV